MDPKLGAALVRYVGFIKSAAETVAVMVSALRGKPSLQQIKNNSANLREAEVKAHQQHLKAMRIIYFGSLDPVQTVMMKCIYDQLEKLLERCDEAGCITSSIVVKQA